MDLFNPFLLQTAMTPSEERMYNQTRKSLLAKIDVAMGGRAAEELFYGASEITTGCSSDLSNATSVAYSYVKHLGMSEISLAALDSSHPGSSKINYEIDMEVQKLLSQSYKRVYKLLQDNQVSLTTLAIELVSKETLSKDDIENLLNINSISK